MKLSILLLLTSSVVSALKIDVGTDVSALSDEKEELEQAVLLNSDSKVDIDALAEVEAEADDMAETEADTDADAEGDKVLHDIPWYTKRHKPVPKAVKKFLKHPLKWYPMHHKKVPKVDKFLMKHHKKVMKKKKVEKKKVEKKKKVVHKKPVKHVKPKKHVKPHAKPHAKKHVVHKKPVHKKPAAHKKPPAGHPKYLPGQVCYDLETMKEKNAILEGVAKSAEHFHKKITWVCFEKED